MYIFTSVSQRGKPEGKDSSFPGTLSCLHPVSVRGVMKELLIPSVSLHRGCHEQISKHATVRAASRNCPLALKHCFSSRCRIACVFTE